MKRKLLLAVFVLAALIGRSQTDDRRWSIGVEGGGQQYNGDQGNAFYNPSRGMYGVFGLSIATYISPHFDLVFAGTDGKTGYKNSSDVTVFKNTMFQANMHLRFSFFKYDKVFARPFLLVGFGDTWFKDVNSYPYSQADNMSLPVFGGGITFKLSQAFNIKIQELFTYPIHTSPENNNVREGYLLHTIGLNYNMGRKHDADHDGVSDKNDMCPNTPAGVKVDKKGCPLDIDSDGVADYQDSCPTIKGPVVTHGCPDSDNDGVVDNNDKCPNTPSGVAVDATGCPLDRDGDGIPDYLDKCPDAKGTQAMGGCPDSDNDGVADNNDRCPNTPAGVKVDASGCPLDRDGDGVPDYKDNCPDVKGTVANNGCPELKQEEKEVFKKALEGIEFETGKDVILKKSYAILDQVVGVMQNNPKYTLAINGYTDNVGKPEKNQELSEKRANAVKNYMTKKGVDASRLTAKGFGEASPRADNKTKEGRTLNRRVEFVETYTN